MKKKLLNWSFIPAVVYEFTKLTRFSYSTYVILVILNFVITSIFDSNWIIFFILNICIKVDVFVKV